MSSYHIRTERREEYHDVEMLVREAFWNVYRPGCSEHFIVHCWRSDPDYLPEMHFSTEFTVNTSYPRGYYMDESMVDGYDRNFPYKKKFKLPTQLGE